MKNSDGSRFKLGFWLAKPAVILLCSAASAATIEGTVRLPKPVSPAVIPARYQNKTPGKVGPPPPPAAIVYLEGQFPSVARTNSDGKPKMAQKHFQFESGLLPVQTGTLVEFPNLDDGSHNVYSISKPKPFDLGDYKKSEQPPAILFDKPGVVKLYCRIHGHMRATILVLDSPYFVKTDAQGNYRLTNLPPGNYSLKAWVNEETVFEMPIALEAGTNLRADFPGT